MGYSGAKGEVVVGVKVLVVHFRVGRTDGVSLEIANWKEILEREDMEVKLAGGPYSVEADWVVPHLENQLDAAGFLVDEEAFGGWKNLSEDEWVKKFEERQGKLEAEFEEMLEKMKPDRLIVSNIWSVGENLAAAGALARVVEKTGVKTVAVHHDFWWENDRYEGSSGKRVRDELGKYFPPVFPNLGHCCINSIARKELARRKGVVAEVLYDSLDFEVEPGRKKEECWGLMRAAGVRPGDSVVLQATRIVRRKNIELAMDVIAGIQKSIKNVVLVISGYAEKRDEEYERQLMKYAKKLGIRVARVNGVVAKGEEPGACSLMDVYPFADLVTYPSVYEGFGNQFLEAVFTKKPVVVFEYPVFKEDIAPLGFNVISMGDAVSYDNDGLAKVPEEVLNRVVSEAGEVLKDKNRCREMTERNFAIGKANFSYKNTLDVWKRVLAAS